MAEEKKELPKWVVPAAVGGVAIAAVIGVGAYLATRKTETITEPTQDEEADEWEWSDSDSPNKKPSGGGGGVVVPVVPVIPPNSTTTQATQQQTQQNAAAAASVISALNSGVSQNAIIDALEKKGMTYEAATNYVIAIDALKTGELSPTALAEMKEREGWSRMDSQDYVGKLGLSLTDKPTKDWPEIQKYIAASDGVLRIDDRTIVLSHKDDTVTLSAVGLPQVYLRVITRQDEKGTGYLDQVKPNIYYKQIVPLKDIIKFVCKEGTQQLRSDNKTKYNIVNQDIFITIADTAENAEKIGRDDLIKWRLYDINMFGGRGVERASGSPRTNANKWGLVNEAKTVYATDDKLYSNYPEMILTITDETASLLLFEDKIKPTTSLNFIEDYIIIEAKSPTYPGITLRHKYKLSLTEDGKVTTTISKLDDPTQPESPSNPVRIYSQSFITKFKQPKYLPKDPKDQTVGDPSVAACIHANQEAVNTWLASQSIDTGTQNISTLEYRKYTYKIRYIPGVVDKYTYKIWRPDGTVLVDETLFSADWPVNQQTQLVKAKIDEDVGAEKKGYEYNGYKFSITYDPRQEYNSRYRILPADMLCSREEPAEELGLGSNYWTIDVTNFKSYDEDHLMNIVKTAMDAKLNKYNQAAALKQARISTAVDDFNRFVTNNPDGMFLNIAAYKPQGASTPYKTRTIAKKTDAGPQWTVEIYAPTATFASRTANASEPKLGVVEWVGMQADGSAKVVEFINNHWASLSVAQRALYNASEIEAAYVETAQYLSDQIKQTGKAKWTPNGQRSTSYYIMALQFSTTAKRLMLGIWKSTKTPQEATIGTKDVLVKEVPSSNPPTPKEMVVAMKWINSQTLNGTVGNIGYQQGNRIVFQNGIKKTKSPPPENYYMDTGAAKETQPTSTMSEEEAERYFGTGAYRTSGPQHAGFIVDPYSTSFLTDDEKRRFFGIGASVEPYPTSVVSRDEAQRMGVFGVRKPMKVGAVISPYPYANPFWFGPRTVQYVTGNALIGNVGGLSPQKVEQISNIASTQFGGSQKAYIIMSEIANLNTYVKQNKKRLAKSADGRAELNEIYNRLRQLQSELNTMR